jgi:hypothetical protein
MKNLVVLLGLLFFVSSPLAAIEIEAKDGRSFSATIVDADETTVTVKKANGGKEFKLGRETLSLETNQNIEGFLKEKRDAADAQKGKRSTFEFVSMNRKFRASLRLPNPDVPIVPITSSVEISGEGRNLGNRLSLSFYSQGTSNEWAEKQINNHKQLFVRSASTQVGTTPQLVELANKTLDVTKVQYGEWTGFVLGAWTDEDAYKTESRNPFHRTQKYAYFTNGEIGLAVAISTEVSGKFRLAFLPDIIGSLSLEEMSKAEK